MGDAQTVLAAIADRLLFLAVVAMFGSGLLKRIYSSSFAFLIQPRFTAHRARCDGRREGCLACANSRKVNSHPRALAIGAVVALDSRFAVAVLAGFRLIWRWLIQLARKLDLLRRHVRGIAPARLHDRDFVLTRFRVMLQDDAHAQIPAPNMRHDAAVFGAATRSLAPRTRH